MSASRLLKSGLVVSVMTFVSRILGLVRDVVIANLMGAGAAADVFFFANKIPNFLRRLFAEGAFAQAFVPVLSEVSETETLSRQRQFIARVAGTLGSIVLLVTILGVIGSPVLAALFGTGWFIDHLNDGPQGHKFELAALMLKITFPYLFFITLTGLSGAILNTLNRFAVAAFTPVLLNVAIISAALWLAPSLAEPGIGLAWGVFIGGVIQLLFQLPFLWRAGVLVKPRWGWKDPGVTKVRKLMIPALFGVSVSQINLLFDTFIASFLMTGSISWLYYSDRLLEFPLGLFGIAIATVILPTLSRNHVQADSRQFAINMDWSVRMVSALGIPAAAGLMVLGYPILMVLFEGGAFTPDDARMASYSLLAYVSGLWGLMLVKVLAPGFFSRQDTKTPVRYGIWCMALNMVFNALLAIPFGYVGLAVATALSGTLNAVLLYQKLHRLGVYQFSPRTLWFLARIALASVVMVAVLLWWRPGSDVWQQWTVAMQIGQLAQMIALGLAALLTTALALGIRLSDFRTG